MKSIHAETFIYNRADNTRYLIVCLVGALAVHFVVLNLPIAKWATSGQPSPKVMVMTIVASRRPVPAAVVGERAMKSAPGKAPVKRDPLLPRDRVLFPKVPSLPKALGLNPAKPAKQKKAATPQKNMKLGHPRSGSPPVASALRAPRRPLQKEAPPESRTKPEPSRGHGPIVRPSVYSEPDMIDADTSVGDVLGSPAVDKRFARAAVETTASPAVAGQGSITYALPKYKDNPPPDYPSIARRRGYEGRTVVKAEIFEDGRVGAALVAESSGFEILDKAAVKSVRKWLFVPGTSNGKEVRQWVMVPVRFKLN